MSTDSPRLDPSVLPLLERRRLAFPHLQGRGGVGEHRSRSRGPGVEFEDHREYAAGDDLRRVDPHLFARFGTPYVRQFARYERLSVRIAIDGSRSMAFGSPAKFVAAARIGCGFAFIALHNMDVVHVGVLREGDTQWRRDVTGRSRYREVEEWLAASDASGEGGFGRALSALRDRPLGGEVIVVVSDFLEPGLSQACNSLQASGAMLIAVRVLSPEEYEPWTMTGVSGMVDLVDSESGAQIPIELTPSTVAAYVDRLTADSDALRREIVRRGGRYAEVRSDEDARVTFSDTLRRAHALQ